MSDTHTLAAMIDGHIALLQGKGLGGNIVRDSRAQLSPPEAATWTGKWQQLAFCVSGLECWLEVRDFRTNPSGGAPLRVAGPRITDLAQFGGTVVTFATRDGQP